MRSGRGGMNWRVVLITLLALLAVSIVTACSQEQEQQEPASASEAQPVVEGKEAPLDGKFLVEQRCAKCHSTDRIYDHKHSSEEWEEVVRQMIAKGAQFNDAERKVVIDYLSSQ